MICCYVVVQQRVTVSARRWQPDGGGGRAQSSHVGAAKRFLQQLLSGCQLPQLQQMSTQIDAALVPGSAAVFVGLLLLKVVNWVGCGRRENLHIPIFTCVYVYRYLLIFGAQAVPGIHSVLQQCHVYRYLLIFGAQAVPGIHFGAPAVPWVYMCIYSVLQQCQAYIRCFNSAMNTGVHIYRHIFGAPAVP